MAQKTSTSAAALREALGRAVAGKPVVLTPETVAAYVEALNLPQFEGKTLVGSDSSTGNLNYCFVVQAFEDLFQGVKGPSSVFVKQAPDFVRCLGEDAKLTTDRIRIEAAAALEFSAHADRGCLPELLHFDAASCVLVMEHLAAHRLLQDAMLAGDVTDAPAIAVARFMAAIHGATLGSGGLAASFTNEALCGITTAYVFTLPFQASPRRPSAKVIDAPPWIFLWGFSIENVHGPVTMKPPGAAPGR
jgi:5-methylthioribose kinase